VEFSLRTRDQPRAGKAGLWISQKKSCLKCNHREASDCVNSPTLRVVCSEA
jgi:hypothetical protein